MATKKANRTTAAKNAGGPKKADRPGASGGSAKPPAPSAPSGDAVKTRGASAEAAAILGAETPGPLVAEQGERMLDARPTVSTQGARIVAEIAAQRPELVVPLTEKLTRGLLAKNKRVVQTSAEALPTVARLAPARVARHLDTLRTSFDSADEAGRDGLVRTFAALCTASVAYQKRLEPVLTKALAAADGKSLLTWCEAVLPALKGEPHARARAVVENRLPDLPRPVAQPVADFLGIKLRPRA
jgi:hypothetical protein